MEQLNKGAASRYSYRNLDTWKRARAIAREIIAIVNRLPKSVTAEVTARQIIRSATSVGANIAEGHGRFSYAAFRSHLLIARGSATETDSWLTVLLDAGLIDEATEDRLHRQCDTLVAALTNHIRSLNQKAGDKKPRIGEERVEYMATSESAHDDDLFDCCVVQKPEEASHDYTP